MSRLSGVPCTSVVPTATPPERAVYVAEHLPAGIFRVEDADDPVPWRISPRPFPLAPATVARIESLGPDLVAFYRALNALYLRSARGTAPAWIAEELDRGKPESMRKLARQNRWKQDIPHVIRPDLILTDGGFIASELDSIPGGMGFVGAMTSVYCELGDESIGGSDGMTEAFAAMARATSGKDRPTVGIVVSDEAGDYRAELSWIAERARTLDLLDAYVLAPQDVVFTEDALFVRRGDGVEIKIDLLYRNFELFDLLNIPKQELMLYAARHGRVKLTPPPKHALEEKAAFALLHHPALRALWIAEFGAEVYDRLAALFPRTWIMDPRPVPPQGAIVGLEAGGVPVREWSQLEPLGKSERDYVVKPSGFSELAWGSRGVKIANDLTREEWHDAIETALASYEQGVPYVLQRFHKGRRVEVEYLDSTRTAIKTMDGRVRLTPYFFVVGDDVRVGGILATIAPADKRVIHGMRDAVMASCRVDEAGY